MIGATHFIEVFKDSGTGKVEHNFCNPIRLENIIINSTPKDFPTVAIFYIREKTEQEKKEWITLNPLKINRQ